MSELYNDGSSWDQTWDDSLWSWDSWDPWGWSSDFPSEPWPAEAASSAKAETLKPKEEQEASSSASGAATLPVSAVTLEGPPGLSVPKAKPKAKANISPSTLLMSGVVLGNFGLGNTFRVDGMTDGDTDPWILFDSGAATQCCAKPFASEWPLLPLTGKAPPLSSIAVRPLTVDFEGQSCFLHFYVCDVPSCVVSVGRL